MYKNNANLSDEWNKRLGSSKISMEQFDQVLMDVQFSSAATGVKIQSLSNETGNLNNNLKNVEYNRKMAKNK